MSKVGWGWIKQMKLNCEKLDCENENGSDSFKRSKHLGGSWTYQRREDCVSSFWYYKESDLRRALISPTNLSRRFPYKSHYRIIVFRALGTFYFLGGYPKSSQYKTYHHVYSTPVGVIYIHVKHYFDSSQRMRYFRKVQIRQIESWKRSSFSVDRSRGFSILNGYDSRLQLESNFVEPINRTKS